VRLILLSVPMDDYVPACYLWIILIDIRIDFSFSDSWCCHLYFICCFLMFDHEISLIYYCTCFRATIYCAALPPIVILFVVINPSSSLLVQIGVGSPATF